MGKVKYKEVSAGMKRMVVEPSETRRPSLGMAEVKGEIYYLDPKLIVPYKKQARKSFPQEDLDSLAESIKSQGILQPLLIIKDPDNEDLFQVVSGERRLRAASIAELDKVPCKILDRGADADYIALIENIQREDLHPLELAQSYADIIEARGITQTDLAKQLGVSKQHISEHIRLLDLPEDLRQEYLEKNVSNLSSLKNLLKTKSYDVARSTLRKSPSSVRGQRLVIKVTSELGKLNVRLPGVKDLDEELKDQLRDELRKLADYI